MDVFALNRTKRRHISPNKHLHISLSMIYYMGMWPTSGRYRCLYLVYTVCSFSFLLGVFLTTEIAHIVVKRHNIDEVVAGATVLMTNATHAYKMKVYVPHILFGMLMYMCCMTYQIFIFCWHGNELYLHSLDISLAAYTNKWWQKTKNFKQAIHIIITRAQRPLILSVGNIMELSLQNFVRILRMSYSIFTVLQTSTSA